MLVREISPELREQYESSGVWANRAFFELVDEAADRQPDKLAVADQFHRLSYADLVELSRSLAAYLIQGGIHPGDAVAVQAPNSVLLPLVHLAVSRVQGVFVPMHEAWRETEVQHLLATSQAKTVLAVRECHGFEQFAMVQGLEDLPALQNLIPLVHGPGGLSELPGPRGADLEAVAGVLAAVPVDVDAARYTMISSGTTSLPKISEWSENMLHALLIGAYQPTSGLQADDIAVGIAPAATGATGYVFPVVAPLMVGASCILLDPWNPDRALELIEEEQATYAVAVPAQIVKMLDAPGARTAKLGSLQWITNGGAPLAEVKARQAEDVLGIRIHTMYGATDGGVPSMMPSDADEDHRVSSTGRAVPGAELRIADETGAEVASGGVGEVIWRGAQSFLGYRNDDENTKIVFDSEGWYRSGDLGSIDDAGYLRIVGRLKDMILRGGQNIFPGEIEEILARSPKVAAVAVVGIPDEVLGERACACVVLRDPSDPLTFDEMIALLEAAKVAKFKRPEGLEAVDEFPMSAGGKVQKAELAKLVLDRRRATHA